MKTGKLYLIPTPLGENEPSTVLPPSVMETACRLHCFVVEELRTVRRFLSAAGLKGHIAELEFHVLNEHTTPGEVEAFASLFDRGDVGLVSEAGLPAVADPGSALVALCHRIGVEVVPLTGPSSLMLALMASGLNGQSFAFRGYLPAKTDERRTAIKEMEHQSKLLNQSQIFIETPYRNDSMLDDLARICPTGTRICCAANLTLPDAFIRTLGPGEWKSMIDKGFKIGKRPCVFLILAK
jgi:16S rRNA (cytidine1402-2'-O)-methyltransferase